MPCFIANDWRTHFGQNFGIVDRRFAWNICDGVMNVTVDVQFEIARRYCYWRNRPFFFNYTSEQLLRDRFFIAVGFGLVAISKAKFAAFFELKDLINLDRLSNDVKWSIPNKSVFLFH